ncbi:MAG: hypothetical protein JRI68_08775 [Deltaproteobacteria bacterium]|nr:hypothetical protein [Deltaproteobacteria bacterium]
MADLERCGALLLGLAATWLMGCGTQGQVLLLDQICNPEGPLVAPVPPCSVSGDAELTTGVSGDTTAVHFGSGTGELRILLSAVQAASQPRWSLDVLAASSRSEGSTLYRSISWGTCVSDCPSDPEDVEAPLSGDFQWAAMVTEVTGSFNVQTSSDAMLTLRGTDIDIIDVRTPGYDSYYYY